MEHKLKAQPLTPIKKRGVGNIGWDYVKLTSKSLNYDNFYKPK
jgi:hypothetical protein